MASSSPHLSPVQLALLDDALRQRLIETDGRIAALAESLKARPPCFADAVERSSYEMQHTLVEKRLEQEQQRRTQILRAIKRMSEGEYGYCERSGEPIPLARLKALPEATTLGPEAETD
ncbi:TraR/DksA family transcriptional regulator [Marinobacter hydrocarbonoclasticus]|nr:TraR/DksA family transcriptional regulator [Marinobacter nauticus]